MKTRASESPVINPCGDDQFQLCFTHELVRSNDLALIPKF